MHPRALFVLIVSILLTPPAAVGAGFDPLRPLGWAESGFGRVDGSPAGVVSTVCRKYTSPGVASLQTGCPGGTSFPGAPFDTEGPFVLDLATGRFEAELVSEIKGNTWTFGLRNMSYTRGGPPNGLPGVGDQTGRSRFGWQRIDLAFDAFASFDVPVRRRVGSVDVAVRPSAIFPPIPSVDVRSALLGPFEDVGLSPVSSYVVGDRVSFFAGHPFPMLRLIAEAVTDDDFVVQEFTVTTTTPCGEGTLEDCLFTLDLFEPRPVRHRGRGSDSDDSDDSDD